MVLELEEGFPIPLTLSEKCFVGDWDVLKLFSQNLHKKDF